MTEIALPDPDALTLTRVRTELVPVVRAHRERIQQDGDIEAARELARRLEAFRRYLTDREGRDIVSAETRRTEALIGQLCGPPREKDGRPAKGETSARGRLPRQRHGEFWLLAENITAVEAALEQGVVSRKALLERIQFGQGRPIALGPDQCSTLVADPPWRYGNTATRANAEGHYDGTLTIAQLCGDELLPDGKNLVKEVVRPKTADKAHLYLWTTAGHLPDAFSVMEAWGFDYKTYLVWVKPQMGMGNYFRVSTELVLFGVKGGMRTRAMDLKNYFEVKRGQHSAKPQKFFNIVAKASPGPYLELFGRCDKNALDGTCQCSKCRLGWEMWGNQS